MNSRHAERDDYDKTQMIWIHPKYRPSLGAASSDAYESLAGLAPTDHFVEKQGRSTGRYVVAATGQSVRFFLKKYFHMSWWQRWLAPLESFPGPRELQNLQRAAALGIPVPEPLAAGADRRHACLSLLAVRELEGHTPLHEFIPARMSLTETTEQRVVRRELTAHIAEIAQRLHSANLYHCDFYLCHFFIRESPNFSAAFELVLIDLMRLKQSRLARWRIKDLAQLLFSSDLPGITRTDRMRFFKKYLGTRRLDGNARWLLRRIQRKASLYHRHNESLAQRAAA